MSQRKKIAIAGAGFAGATLARELAATGDYEISVFEQRPHVAGNCHTVRDPSSQVMVHVYGPHIFHTDREDIWNYVNQFGEFVPYVNRVRAQLDKGLFQLPVNLHTINQFFQRQFDSDQARAFIAAQADTSIKAPQNFEEQALAMMGPDLYQAFFYGYTRKQWGCEPAQLPASILKRLPLRFIADDNYYADPWQGIPRHGYTSVVNNLLDAPEIQVRLGQTYDKSLNDKYHWVFYTGTLDGYFEYSLGALGYRTVYWEERRGPADLQAHAVINYPGMDVPYTRIHEHKHFAPWEQHDQSVAYVEYSKETTSQDVPYYPKRLPEDMLMFERYCELAAAETNVSFLGRLGTYRYMDMHHVIAQSISFAATAHGCFLQQAPAPVFPN